MQQISKTPHRSFWLQDIVDDSPDCATLDHDLAADIVIVGGGYVGLWTAINIKKYAPKTRVVIIEKDICGGGASGRNGGFALSYWPKYSSLIKLCGIDAATKICRDSEAAIDEIDEVMKLHMIDVQFRKSPWLWTATSSAQMGAWEAVVQLCEKNRQDVFDRLEPRDVMRRTGSSVHRAGVLEKSAATLHPARLARGLRTICLKMGVEIFENTRMISFSRSAPVTIKTDRADICANALVLATNAWAASIPELSRSIVAITSDMIMTAPIPDLLQQIGWTGGECITDSQTMVDYYHATKDGRIAFGKGGWGIALGGRLGTNFDRNQSRAKIVSDDFRRYYPELAQAPITHDWCGPIDRTPNGLPLLGRLPGPRTNIFYGVGWSGNGVGPSVLGGKILASLALNLDNEWARYPLVEKSVGKFPPEPIRFIGAHVVRSAVAARERAEINDRRPNWLSVQLSKLAPSGLEDKK